MRCYSSCFCFGASPRQLLHAFAVLRARSRWRFRVGARQSLHCCLVGCCSATYATGCTDTFDFGPSVPKCNPLLNKAPSPEPPPPTPTPAAPRPPQPTASITRYCPASKVRMNSSSVNARHFAASRCAFWRRSTSISRSCFLWRVGGGWWRECWVGLTADWQW